MTTDRRRFLGTLGAAFAAPSLLAQDVSPAESSATVDSPPCLQLPSQRSVTIVWSVRQPAAGTIEFGTDKDNLTETASGEICGLKAYHDRVLQVQIGGLQPNTRYYYRTVTRRFKFITAYRFEQGEPEYSGIFSFETAGKNKPVGSFSSINDTHNKPPTLRLLAERLRQINSDYTVWNGDVVDYYPDDQRAIDTILKPGGSFFAAEKPILFVPGNHDHRGEWARKLPMVLPNWSQEAAKDQPLGRNFVVRTGPLALIGLDTGEDKPDDNKEYGGLVHFEPYRNAQRDWLRRVLRRQEVASAPFVAVFCHIPMVVGKIPLPTVYKSWGSLLTEHRVQVVISGHTHRFAYEEPTPDRSWAQITGGGWTIDPEKGNTTVIHGKAEGNTLTIVADNVARNTELGRWTFAARS